MSAGLNLVLVLLFTVFSSAISQFYAPYNQYGYQYYPNQDLIYQPYPYQSYVNSPYVPSYINYAQPSYPIYGYPNPGQQVYPYSYTYPQYTTSQGYPVSNGPSTINNAAPNHQVEGEDPYANIKVEVIDVEPKNFHYYKKLFNLEDNAYPVQVIEDDSVKGGDQAKPQVQPYYTVKTDSTSYNYTTVPQGVNIHDVKSKSYSFKRTFTLDPTKKENAVIKLNFVNGVQVNTTEQPQEDWHPEGGSNHEEDAVTPVATEEDGLTTTESEEPEGLSSWFR